MSTYNNGLQVAYGLTNALQTLAPEPIISSRNPLTSDNAPKTTLWLNKLTASLFACGGTANGKTIWYGIANAPLTVNSATETAANQVGIYSGTGAPSFAAPKGSLYLRVDGSSNATRAYSCSVATGTWVAVTTAS